MYKLQSKPDEEALLDNNEIVRPIATLKNEFGGVMHIINDDHCYILIQGGWELKYFQIISWWNREAVEVLKTLPLPE